MMRQRWSLERWIGVAVLLGAGIAAAQGIPTRETAGSTPGTPGTIEGTEPERSPIDRQFVPIGPGRNPGPKRDPEGTPICDNCLTCTGCTATAWFNGDDVAEKLVVSMTLSAPTGTAVYIQEVGAKLKSPSQSVDADPSSQQSWTTGVKYGWTLLSSKLGSMKQKNVLTASTTQLEIEVTYKVPGGSTVLTHVPLVVKPIQSK